MNTLTDLLFHTPWWLPTFLGIIGVVLFITGNNRQEFRIRTAGLVTVALAILLAVVSYLVDTDLEKAEKGTRALVHAVEQRDWNTLSNLLDAHASVAVQNAGTVANNRTDIVNLAHAGVDQFGLRHARVTSLDSRQEQTLITITIDALTEQDQFQYPLPSQWQFEWQRTHEGVRVMRITNLKVGNETGAGARAKFPKP